MQRFGTYLALLPVALVALVAICSPLLLFVLDNDTLVGFGWTFSLFILPVCAGLSAIGLCIKAYGYFRGTVRINLWSTSVYLVALLVFSLLSSLAIFLPVAAVVVPVFAALAWRDQKASTDIPTRLSPGRFFILWAVFIVGMYVTLNAIGGYKTDQFLDKATNGTGILTCQSAIDDTYEKVLAGYCDSNSYFFKISDQQARGYTFTLLSHATSTNTYGVSVHVFKVKVEK